MGSKIRPVSTMTARNAAKLNGAAFLVVVDNFVRYLGPHSAFLFYRFGHIVFVGNQYVPAFDPFEHSGLSADTLDSELESVNSGNLGVFIEDAEPAPDFLSPALSLFVQRAELDDVPNSLLQRCSDVFAVQYLLEFLG